MSKTTDAVNAVIGRMPPLQTDRGRLRFFTVSETRLDATDDGVPIIDSRKQTFSVLDDGNVRLAHGGEVTEFLGLYLHGPLSQAAQSDESHSGEDHPHYQNGTPPLAQTHHR